MATINTKNILSEMRRVTNYLNGYFTNRNGQISEDISNDDFIIESEKISDLNAHYQTLRNFVRSGFISIEDVSAELDNAIILITKLNEWQETKKGSQSDFLNVQNCNDLATINTTKISK